MEKELRKTPCSPLVCRWKWKGRYGTERQPCQGLWWGPQLSLLELQKWSGLARHPGTWSPKTQTPFENTRQSYCTDKGPLLWQQHHYLKKCFHHTTGDKSFPSSVIAGQVVEEWKECSGKLVRVWFHQRIWKNWKNKTKQKKHLI